MKEHNLLDSHYLRPDDSLEEWCKKYDLEVKESKCLYCEEIIRTTIPAFGKTWRGLVSPKCPNGHESNLKYCVLTDDAHLPEFFNNL